MTVKGKSRIPITFEREKMIEEILEGTEIQQTPRVADIFAQISCYVCQAPSSGIHFGKNNFAFLFLLSYIDFSLYDKVLLLVKVVK